MPSKDERITELERQVAELQEKADRPLIQVLPYVFPNPTYPGYAPSYPGYTGWPLQPYQPYRVWCTTDTNKIDC